VTEDFKNVIKKRRRDEDILPNAKNGGKSTRDVCKKLKRTIQVAAYAFKNLLTITEHDVFYRLLLHCVTGVALART
jgi:hypothetical protein